MIARLRGRIAHRDPTSLVVDVDGVGYLVHVPAGERLPTAGEVELWTSLQVREDSLTLYGFAERSSQQLFELLLGSSGVGPRLALAALGTHRPDALRAAIAAGDVATLTQVPGIGRKVADRLVLELRDKLPPLEWAPSPAAGPAAPEGTASPAGEAREALVALGYTTAEADAALAEVGPSDAEVSELVRDALRVLGARRLDGTRR